MAIFEFKLPDLGEGVMEGEIVKWLVKPGDVIKEDAGVVEIMTDKATVTIPTPRGGKVLKTHGAEGEVAKVHHRLVDFEVGDGEAHSKANPVNAPAVNGQAAAPKPSAPRPSAPRPSAPAASVAEKVLATPVTRRMAREHNIDLAKVPGTGPQGRVLKTDVEAFLSAPPTPSAGTSAVARSAFSWTALASGGADERVPLKGLRKKIAEKMVRSKFTAPHYAFVEEVDATALIALRATLNAALAKDNVKLSFLPFLVKAVVAALRAFPQVNANMDEATNELIIRGGRNLGIATMTEHGLVVPVVHGADRLSLRGLSSEITRLATAAREQKLKMEEITHGSFTITSLGQTGGLFATPIINHPEVAIMGVHRMRKRPMVSDDDSIVIKQIMNFSFCFDHRVIDGATGAEFAYEVIRFVEHPELLLVDMI